VALDHPRHGRPETARGGGARAAQRSLGSGHRHRGQDGLRHNFSVRYLAPYREVLAEKARSRDLEEPWSGVVRQESRFITGAKSSAGRDRSCK